MGPLCVAILPALHMVDQCHLEQWHLQLVFWMKFSFHLLVLADEGMLRTDDLSFNIAWHDPYIFLFICSDDALRRRSFFEPHWPFAQKF